MAKDLDILSYITFLHHKSLRIRDLLKRKYFAPLRTNTFRFEENKHIWRDPKITTIIEHSPPIIG